MSVGNKKVIKWSAIAFVLAAAAVLLTQLSMTAVSDSRSGEKATIIVATYADFVPDRVSAQTKPPSERALPKIEQRRIGLPDALAGRIIEKLSNSQRFTVVERQALRRIVLEQRFGREMDKTYLDRTLDEAIDNLEDIKGGTAADVASWSDYNDLVKDFQDLGTASGADFIVLGDLERQKQTVTKKRVPYSNNNRSVQSKQVDARLRLRIINTADGSIVGVGGVKTQISELLFEGKESDTDVLDIYDRLASSAAAEILDITFPARIVSTEPLIISRGGNDGVSRGDQYDIYREGKEIRNKDGLLLARLKTKVGTVKVADVQETIATVAPASGEGFQVDDLAELAGAQDTGKAAAVADQSPVPIKTNKVKVPRIAVGLVKLGATGANADAQSAQKHTPIFTDTMISRLTQTKRFQLIDRQEVDQLLNEQFAQALAENRDVPSAVGTLKGADYLIYGNLASIADKKRITNISNRTFTQRIGIAGGNMRIVDARSGDILESRKISVEQNIEPSASKQRMVDKLADAYAEQVVLMLMNALYPIKVAHVDANGQVYINRGDDGGLFVGEELDVYRLGQAIIDPDTGVQLGTSEEHIGKLVVNEVEDARSKGKMMEGTGIGRGDLLKRTAKNKDKRAGLAAQQQKASPGRSGGVVGEKPDKTGKPTLALGSFSLIRSARTIDGFNNGHLQRIADEVAARLTNSKRFSILERGKIGQVLDEKEFEALVSGGDMQSRLGEMKGADYLIYSGLNNFYIDTKRKKVPYTNETQVITSVNVEGVFNIVDVHTGNIVSAEKIKIKDTIKGIDDATEIVSQMISMYGTQATAQIIARLYPIKVLGASDDGRHIYINRGEEAGMKKGDWYDVMRLGQVLKDPDTGESFGRSESKMATVEIVAIEGARSVAKLVRGETPDTGDVLRKADKPVESPKQPFKRPNW